MNKLEEIPKETKMTPCPFCGGYVMRIERIADYVMRVLCRTCLSSGAFGHDKADVIAKWNSRFPNNDEVKPAPLPLVYIGKRPKGCKDEEL